MQCEKVGDERLVADKMDLLYGEADAEVRARVEAHLAGCAPCRDEMAGLRAVRGDLAAWRRPAPRAVFTPRGLVVPRWLAAAAVFLAALGVTLGATGYLQMRRALAAGLWCSRLDGSPLRYNNADPYLPDLLICRPEYAADAIRAARNGHG